MIDFTCVLCLIARFLLSELFCLSELVILSKYIAAEFSQ